MGAHIHAAYQFWNLMISIMRQEDAVSIVHHVSACTLGLVLCNQGFGSYWCLYLGGVSETSTSILSIMDIFKLNPYLQKDYPTLNVAVRATFCVAFLIARVFIWWYVVFWFYIDLYYFWGDYGDFQRPHFTVVVNLISWTALTVIQLIWGKLVVKGLGKALGLIAASTEGPQTGIEGLD